MRGKVACYHVLATHSLLWTEAWRLLEDRGEDFLKCVVHGLTTPRLNAGNVLADRFAKWAARAGRRSEQQHDLLNSRLKVLKS